MSVSETLRKSHFSAIRADDDPEAEVANRKGKRIEQIKVVSKKLIRVLVVVMSIPESGGIEDQKVSSPKW